MLSRRQWIGQTLAAPLLAQPGRKPNIVFIFSDDHHYQGLGVSGNPHIQTPNLDRLAKAGVRFVNGIVSTSQCNPSRGIMLSGREAIQTGLESNGRTNFTKDIRPSVVEQLRAAGYDTIQIGKWHIIPKQSEQGFNRAPLSLAGGSSVYRDPKLRHGFDGQDEVTPGHITDLFTEAAIGEVKKAKQPYFLWLSYNAPHSPLYAADKYVDLYSNKSNAQLAPPAHGTGGKPFNWSLYYAVISHLDEAVGRLVRAIEAAGQWENTVVFFVGDNGLMAGTRGWGGKVRHWDESIRIPYFVTGGPVKKGVVVQDAVASIDATATWLDLAGVKPEKPLPGRSLLSYLKTGRGTIDAAYSSWLDGREEGLTVGVAIEPYRLVRTDRYKLVVFESKKKELYDCVADPEERLNLIDDPRSTALRSRMEVKLKARLKAIGDPALAWM